MSRPHYPPIRVLFIVPPETDDCVAEKSPEVNEAFGTYAPLGLMYIATCLRQELPGLVDVRIVDCSLGRWEEERLGRVIGEARPHVVGMTAFTPSILGTRKALALVRKIAPECVTVLGGPHVTTFGADALAFPEIDYAIMGYGERAFLALVRALFRGAPLGDVPGLVHRVAGDTVVQPMRDDLIDLDALPIPDRTLVPFREYRCPVGTREVMATLVSSRGCPFPCTFCNSCDKTYRARDMAGVVREVCYLAGLGVKEVFFFDDLFNLDNRRVFEFCELLRREGITVAWGFKSRVSNVSEDLVRAVRQAGCERIHFGIEADTDKALKALKKMITVDQVRSAVRLCRRHGVDSVGSFMVNLPGDTREDIRRRIAFAKSLQLDYVQFGVLVAYSHTEVFRRGVVAGHWPADIWLRHIRDPAPGFQPPIWPNGIPREELHGLVQRGLTEFYLRPAYILRRLRNLRGRDEAVKFVRGALKVLRLRKPTSAP